MYWPGGLGSPGLPGLDKLNTAALVYAPQSGTDGGSGTRGAGGGGGGMGADTCIPGSGGGAGGEGGEPGIDIYDNGEWPGTSGGHGGQGGNGGQGGGGASVGVLAIDARAVVNSDTTITVGKGGYGGQGGHVGWQGVSKPIAQETTVGGSLPAVGDFDGDGLKDEVDACPIAAGSGNGCPGTAAGPPPGSGGHTSPSSVATVSVLPEMSCMPKAAFMVKLNPRKSHMKSAKLTLDGHRLKLVKGKRRWAARVDLSHSNRTSHTLTIRGKLSDGRSFKQTRHYRTCAH